eukprot:1917130-Pyramimonas_sp.AAC.1
MEGGQGGEGGPPGGGVSQDGEQEARGMPETARGRAPTVRAHVDAQPGVALEAELPGVAEEADLRARWKAGGHGAG